MRTRPVRPPKSIADVRRILAQHIANVANSATDILARSRVVSLLASAYVGAAVQGEFEERLNDLEREVKKAQHRQHRRQRPAEND